MKYKNQIAYWNAVSKEKEFTTQLNIKLLTDYLNKEALIVDYGCGYGRTLNEIYQSGYKNLLGFDNAAQMIERGASEYPFLKIKTCADHKIDCPSNTVDMVILFAVLTCIRDNSDQKVLMDEIWRALKPGGYVYINDFLVNSDQRNLDRYAKYAEKYGTYGVFELEEGGILRHHQESWLSGLTANFEPVHTEKTVFKTMNGHESNGFVFLGRKK